MEERTVTHAKGHGANGVAATSPAVTVASAVPYDDPMSKVLGLDAKTSTLGAWFGFGSAGTLGAAAVMTLASIVAWMHATSPDVPDKPSEYEVVEEAPPPPPPPTAAPQPEAKPVAPAPKPAMEAPPPPAPAQAAKILAAEPKPDEPLDLTGNTFVQGNADSYAGGFTTATGTSTAAAQAPPSPTGVPGGTGQVQAPAPAPAGPDRSRKPALSGGSEWSCGGFPPEADVAQVDEAYVTLQIDVSPTGSASNVQVLADPGNGFGPWARRCALGKHYATALDHDGNAIPGQFKTRVHFSR
jgi:outer membrane biosynthesis protein TonB